MELSYKQQTIGSTDSGSGEVYSTEEQVIGTWVNGEPLYRKVITYTAANFSSGNLEIGTLENAQLRSVHGTFIRPDNQYSIPYAASGNAFLSVRLFGTRVQLMSASMDYTGSVTISIILEYTKTTD